MPATIPDPVYTDAHGSMRVTGTRVLLELVTGLLDAGETAEDVVDRYPSLTVDRVHAVADYFRRHEAEVRAYVKRQEEERARMFEEIERRFPLPEDIIERLKARRPDLFPKEGQVVRLPRL